MRGFLLAGAGAVWLTLASPALSAGHHLCWVSDVRADGAGVSIRFFDPVGGATTAAKTGERRWFTASADGVTLTDKDYRPASPKIPALLLGIGDKVFVSTIPEDVCTLTVRDNNGRIVLEAEAAGQTPDHHSVSRSETISVEPAQ